MTSASITAPLLRPDKFTIPSGSQPHLAHVSQTCLEGNGPCCFCTAAAHRCICRCVPAFEECRRWCFTYCRNHRSKTFCPDISSMYSDNRVEVQIAEKGVGRFWPVCPGCRCTSHSVSGTHPRVQARPDEESGRVTHVSKLYHHILFSLTSAPIAVHWTRSLVI